jgi:phosphoserine phosphatase
MTSLSSLSSAQNEFVDSVLALKPRAATFDCDGTLWSGDAGEGFFAWELENGFVSNEIRDWARARYAEYRLGKVAEDVMCGEMVTMHRGLREERVQEACDAFFTRSMTDGIFGEMKTLVERLRNTGCDLWVVSSSSVWAIRSGMKYFDIPSERILATEVEIKNGEITDRLVRVPSGPGKAEAIRSVLATPPDCAFGNAIWDREMLALSKHAFAINPNPNLKAIALESGWKIYQPETNHRER